MKPVALFLLPCTLALACVALPPPLPPDRDPANAKATEAPPPGASSTLAREPAGGSATPDAGPPTLPHHHDEGMQMGDAGMRDAGPAGGAADGGGR